MNYHDIVKEPRDMKAIWMKVLIVAYAVGVLVFIGWGCHTGFIDTGWGFLVILGCCCVAGAMAGPIDRWFEKRRP